MYVYFEPELDLIGESVSNIREPNLGGSEQGLRAPNPVQLILINLEDW